MFENYQISDEFLGGLGTSGNIGNLSWLLGAGTVVNVPGSNGHPGVVQVRSAAAINSLGRIVLSPVLATAMSVYADNIMCVQALVNFTQPQINGTFIFGLTATPATPTTGQGIIMWKPLTVTGNIRSMTLGAINSTQLIMPATGASGWHLLEFIINPVLSSVEFYYDKILKTTHNTNIPLGTSLLPIISVHTFQALVATVNVDFFGMLFQSPLERW